MKHNLYNCIIFNQIYNTNAVYSQHDHLMTWTYVQIIGPLGDLVTGGFLAQNSINSEIWCLLAWVDF